MPSSYFPIPSHPYLPPWPILYYNDDINNFGLLVPNNYPSSKSSTAYILMTWLSKQFKDHWESRQSQRQEATLNLTPLPLKFTDSPWTVTHMCPHSSDSSTRWPTSKRLFHHTDFFWRAWMFCIAASLTDLVEQFWGHTVFRILFSRRFYWY